MGMKTFCPSRTKYRCMQVKRQNRDKYILIAWTFYLCKLDHLIERKVKFCYLSDAVLATGGSCR